jgi:hypothetical protein
MSTAAPMLNWSDSSADSDGFETMVVVTWTALLQLPKGCVPVYVPPAAVQEN